MTKQLALEFVAGYYDDIVGCRRSVRKEVEL